MLGCARALEGEERNGHADKKTSFAYLCYSLVPVRYWAEEEVVPASIHNPKKVGVVNEQVEVVLGWCCYC